MNPHEEFNKNMQKLLVLLGKILRTNKDQLGTDLNELINNKKSVNVNLCIFTFLPMSQEDMEDLEDMFDEMNGEEGQGFDPEGELKFELDSKDVDFLKTHGIRF